MNTSTLHLIGQSWRAWINNDSRCPMPLWLNLVWTLVFSCVSAMVFWLLNIGFSYHPDVPWRFWLGLFPFILVVSICIGLCVKGSFILGARWLGWERIQVWTGLRRMAYFSGMPLLGVAIGWPLGEMLVALAIGWPTSEALTWRLNSMRDVHVGASSILFSLAVAAMFYLFFAMVRRRMLNEQREIEAQLRLLQGQIEPHFLFNTLANVVSLIDHDAPRAKQMLESFTDYLRSSFASLRNDQATLGSELDLVQHYLALLKTRMEDRLDFSISCDAAARNAAMPPLLLQPLVENAIHHGLEPKVEGGSVRIAVKRDGDALVLEVADDGMGLGESTRRGGVGVALTNVRQRLQTQWGNAASLTLTASNPGTLATLRIPFQSAGAA